MTDEPQRVPFSLAERQRRRLSRPAPALPRDVPAHLPLAPLNCSSLAEGQGLFAARDPMGKGCCLHTSQLVLIR